jgi:hypothetical protein
MKVANLNLALWLNCWAVWCLKGSEKVVFWFTLLFSRLLQRDFDELVLVMERDPNYSMETFYEMCESWLCEGTSEEILGEQKDEERRNIYDVG